MHKLKLLAAAMLVAGAAPISTHISFGRSLAGEQGQYTGPVEQATSSLVLVADREPVYHGDGVTSKIHVRLSGLFKKEGSPERVKCLSYVVMFQDSNGTLLGHAFGQVDCPEGSSEVTSIPMASIDPYLKAAESPGVQHSYVIYIAPALDKTWGATEQFQVLCNLSRLE